jgi:phage baseplate assembly protein gpV
MSLVARIEALEYQIADLKRRQSNYIRPGVVASFAGGPNAIVANIGTLDAPVLTHPIPLFTHGGTGKSWRPMKVGQQVTLLCPDGDLANAVALPGGFHDQNPAPSQSADEDIENQRGQGRLRATDTAQFLEFGSTSVEVEDGKITISAGGVKVVVSGSGVAVTGGEVTHNGHDIGCDHVHTLVTPGGGDSGPPP